MQKTRDLKASLESRKEFVVAIDVVLIQVKRSHRSAVHCAA